MKKKYDSLHNLLKFIFFLLFFYTFNSYAQIEVENEEVTIIKLKIYQSLVAYRQRIYSDKISLTNANIKSLENLLFNRFDIKISRFNLSHFENNFKFYHVEFNRKTLEKNFEVGILHDKHIFIIDSKLQKAYWVLGNVLMCKEIFDFIQAAEIKKNDLLELSKNKNMKLFLNKKIFKLYLKYIRNNKFTMNLLSFEELSPNDKCELTEKELHLLSLFLLNNFPLTRGKKKNEEMLKNIKYVIKSSVYVKKIYHGGKAYPYGNLVLYKLKFNSPDFENVFNVGNLPNKDIYLGIELSRNLIYCLNESKEANLFTFPASCSALIEIEKMELYANTFNLSNFYEVSQKLKRCKKYLLKLEDSVYGKMKLNITSVVCDF